MAKSPSASPPSGLRANLGTRASGLGVYRVWGFGCSHRQPGREASDVSIPVSSAEKVSVIRVMVEKDSVRLQWQRRCWKRASSSNLTLPGRRV